MFWGERGPRYGISARGPYPFALTHAHRVISRSQLLAFREQAQSQLEEILPATITIAGVEYVCAGGTIDQQGAAFGSGGQVIDTQIKFRILKSILGGIPPAPDTIITYQGEDYRIASVVNGTTDPAFILTCEQVVKGS